MFLELLVIQPCRFVDVAKLGVESVANDGVDMGLTTI